jgi:integrase
MPLVRKPGSPFWWYDFYFEGKRYRESTKQKTKQAAATVEAAALTSLIQGIQPSRRTGRAPTLREFSVRFLAWTKNTRTLKPNSRKYYDYGWRLLSFSPLASMHIDQITAEVVDCTAFLRPVVDRRTRLLTDELVECSLTYTAQALRTLKVMLGQAEEWELIPRRPKFCAPKSPGRDRLIDGAAEAGLELQLTKPVKHRTHALLRLQAWVVTVCLQDAGMRPFEVFPTLKENIYWADRRIWIPASKTKRGERFVGMSERMHYALAVWLHGDETPGWAFPARSRRSKTGHLTTIRGSFKTARDNAHLDPRIVPYTARHTFGTFGMTSTKNVFAVSAAMGHADIKSMEPYQHHELDQLVEAVNQRNTSRTPVDISSHTFGHTALTIVRKRA